MHSTVIRRWQWQVMRHSLEELLMVDWLMNDTPWRKNRCEEGNWTGLLCATLTTAVRHLRSFWRHFPHLKPSRKAPVKTSKNKLLPIDPDRVVVLEPGKS